MEENYGDNILPMAMQTHPLLISPVTCKIMDYLSIQDLLKCRLVNRLWNASSCLSLRQKKRKTIKFRMKLEDLEQYTQLMMKSPDMPFSYYELEFFDLSEPVVQSFLRTCGKTMNSLQLNMCRCTTLKIAEILFEEATQLKSFCLNCDPIEDVGSILCKESTSGSNNNNNNNNGKKLSLPHLKSLSLIGEHSQNSQLISDLIEAAYNLENIKIRCYALEVEESAFERMVFDVLTVVNNNTHSSNSSDTSANNNNNNNASDRLISYQDELERQQCQTLKKLKKLQMHYRLKNNEQLIRLSRKNLQLTHLNINLNCDSISPTVLFNFLQGLSHSLEVLEIDFGEGVGSREKLYRFPLLGNLTRLVLTQFKGSSLSYLINNNYTFLSLRYLSLINCGPLTTSFFDLNLGNQAISSTTTTVNNNNNNTIDSMDESSLSPELSLPCKNKFASKLESLVVTSLIEDPEVITQISTQFPNLIAVDLQLTNCTLRKVFERLSKLQELVVFCGDRITDEGWTGIKEEDLIWVALEDDENVMMDYENSFRQSHNLDFEEDDDDGPKPSKTTKRQFRRYPFVGDLLNLRVLKIQEGINLSDASVIHGFIHNVHLTSISLTNSQITDISLRNIAERLTRLRRFETLSSSSIFTNEEKMYLRKKLYMCDFILGHQDLQLLYCPVKKSQMELVLDFFSN